MCLQRRRSSTPTKDDEKEDVHEEEREDEEESFAKNFPPFIVCLVYQGSIKRFVKIASLNVDQLCSLSSPRVPVRVCEGISGKIATVLYCCTCSSVTPLIRLGLADR